MKRSKRSIGLFFLSLIAAVVGCRQQPAAARLQEAWDSRSQPQNMGLAARSYDGLRALTTTQGATTHKPWADSYWPYFRKSIAYRYLADPPTFDHLADQLAAAADDLKNPFLSPAEKYDLVTADASFGLTRHSWQSYESHRAAFGDATDTWSWMGICNGWASAALNEPAPLHHVLAVRPDGAEVLVLAGDVRALISRAYDLNRVDGGTKMIGSRCDLNDADVVRDSAGRTIDGQFADGAPFRIVQDYSAQSGAILIETIGTDAKLAWLLLTKPVPALGGDAEAFAYASRADLVADVLAHAPGAHASPVAKVALKLYKACRDVNPASFHLALVGLVSDGAPAKQGLVVEINPTKAVWNYPVWGFTTSVGELQPVAAEAPEERILRSTTAAYVASVKTRVVYGEGAGLAPAAAYPNDEGETINWRILEIEPDRYSHFDLSYTLEFDASGFVIGGEWDPSTTMPDFAWRAYGHPTDVALDGSASPLKFSLVQKLLDCSRHDPDVVVHRDSAGGADFQAARCPL